MSAVRSVIPVRSCASERSASSRFRVVRIGPPVCIHHTSSDEPFMRTPWMPHVRQPPAVLPFRLDADRIHDIFSWHRNAMNPALRNFHLPLPQETYERLKEEAAK